MIATQERPAISDFAVAFAFVSIAARIPVTGYKHQWMSRLANPVLGWIMGWISFAFLAVVAVAVDYAIASTVLPVLLGYTGTLINAWLITGFVLILQTLLVGFSTRWTERVRNFAVYIIKRRPLAASRSFSLGRFEVPVLALAAAWLVFELAIFRDASFARAWIYVAIMLAVGAVYLIFLLIRRSGPSGTPTPDLASIDTELDADTDLHGTRNGGHQ